MTKTDDEAITAWQCVEAPLETWFEFEEKFVELPEYVRRFVERAMVRELWDLSSPARRRNLARQSDCNRHPGLSRARHAVSQKVDEIQKWECLEERTPTDVETKRKTLIKLRKELVDIEAAMQQEAENLGLSWPFDNAQITDTPAPGSANSAKTNPPPYPKLLRWWTDDYLPLHEDLDKRPNANAQRAAVAAQFPDHAPPTVATMQRLRAEKVTPAEWRDVGRRPKSI